MALMDYAPGQQQGAANELHCRSPVCCNSNWSGTEVAILHHNALRRRLSFTSTKVYQIILSSVSGTLATRFVSPDSPRELGHPSSIPIISLRLVLGMLVIDAMVR
jgi:hypothetical protein